MSENEHGRLTDLVIWSNGSNRLCCMSLLQCHCHVGNSQQPAMKQQQCSQWDQQQDVSSRLWPAGSFILIAVPCCSHFVRLTVTASSWQTHVIVLSHLLHWAICHKNQTKSLSQCQSQHLASNETAMMLTMGSTTTHEFVLMACCNMPVHSAWSLS